MNGRITRLLAASMVPLAPASPDLLPPSVRLEPPALEEGAPDPTPGIETVTYTSAGNELGSPLGKMRLSANSAAFEHHQGEMTLELAGVLPAFSGYRIASEFLSGALVYRVTNAEDYFRDNPTICGGKPLKFIVAKFTSLHDIEVGPAASVNLLLLSLDDYNDFRPTMSDPCGGDTYKSPKK